MTPYTTQLRSRETAVFTFVNPAQYRDVSKPTFASKVKALREAQASAQDDFDKGRNVAKLAEKILKELNYFLYENNSDINSVLDAYSQTPNAKIQNITFSELESLHLFLMDIYRGFGQVLIEEI